MNALQERLESRRARLLIKTEYTVSLGRPVPDFTGGGRPSPTAGMAEPLRFREVGFALAPRSLGKLPLNRDSSEISNVFDRFLLTRTWAAWVAVVHGKCSDHFTFGGKDRSGPTRAERVRQSQFAKIDPQRISRNVGDNHLFGAISSRSA